MNDLKLIDELLGDLKDDYPNRSWKDVENFSSVTRDAMARLREAWASGEMSIITLSLANYFEVTAAQHGKIVERRQIRLGPPGLLPERRRVQRRR